MATIKEIAAFAGVSRFVKTVSAIEIAVARSGLDHQVHVLSFPLPSLFSVIIAQKHREREDAGEAYRTGRRSPAFL